MLQSVELVNFLSHSNTKLVFGNGVTIFVGPNGAGKSSVIDGITFALFGHHMRSSTKGLLRRGSSEGYVKVEFRVGNKHLVATRKIDSKGTVAAQLYEANGEEKKLIASGERKQFGESMTRTIETLIGLDFDKLKIASLVQQGELQSIIEADPRKFKELVNAIIGIDKLDTGYETMRKIIDEFRETVKKRLGYDDTSIQVLKIKIESAEKEIRTIEPKRKQLEDRRKDEEAQFLVLQDKVNKESPMEAKISELETRKAELIGYLKDAITQMKNEISDKERKLLDCTDCLSKIASKTETEQQFKLLEEDLEDTRRQIRELSEKMGKLSGQQEIAGKLKLINGKCPVCDSKVDHLNPFFEEEHIRNEIDMLEKNLAILHKKERSTGESVKKTDSEFRQIIKAENTLTMNGIKDENDLTKLRKDVLSLKTNIEKIPREITSSENLLQLAIDDHSSSLIRSISTLQEEAKGFSQERFKEAKNSLDKKRREISLLDQDIGATKQKLVSLKSEQGEISKILNELEIIKQYIGQLELIRNQIYNRDGSVATSLRSWALDVISQKASEYLNSFNVKIQRVMLEDKTRDIGITCYCGNSHLELESLSGGERVSLALALRLGMAHLMGSSNLGFIILDEPTIHLDQERRKSLVSVLSQAFEANMDNISQFVIITHDSEIFENSNVDAVYSFNLEANGTKVFGS